MEGLGSMSWYYQNAKPQDPNNLSQPHKAPPPKTGSVRLSSSGPKSVP